MVVCFLNPLNRWKQVSASSLLVQMSQDLSTRPEYRCASKKRERSDVLVVRKAISCH